MDPTSSPSASSASSPAASNAAPPPAPPAPPAAPAATAAPAPAPKKRAKKEPTQIVANILQAVRKLKQPNDRIYVINHLHAANDQLAQGQQPDNPIDEIARISRLFSELEGADDRSYALGKIVAVHTEAEKAAGDA